MGMLAYNVHTMLCKVNVQVFGMPNLVAHAISAVVFVTPTWYLAHPHRHCQDACLHH